jgi:hypothetical protein
MVSSVLAGMAACSDDDTNDGTGLGGSAGATANAGDGGSAGATASAGDAGASGSSGNAGSAGQAGDGGAGGSDAPPPPDVSPQATCSGCVELIAPVVGPRSPNNVADEASYIFALGAPVDFSEAVITWRIAAVQPDANYSVVLLVQNGQALNFAGIYAETTLNPAAFPANEFREISVDLRGIAAVPGNAPDAGDLDAGGLGAPDAGDLDAGDEVGANVDAGDAGEPPVTLTPAVVGGFDKSQVVQFGLFIGVNEAFNGSATVRVAVDRVSVAGVPGQPDRTFTAGTEGLAINQYNIPPGTPNPVHHP